MPALLFALLVTLGVAADEYHLTARPWAPLNIPSTRYLDVVEGVCRFSIRHQATSGAIIDPFLHREHQYATPYFAYAVGTLIEAGRARDLIDAGKRAMEHSTAALGNGRKAIPDEHGEFFIPALTAALDLYRPHVPRPTWEAWRERMKKPTAGIVQGNRNNWETYVMKGDWLRVRAGLLDRAVAVDEIEEAWRERHSKRIAPPPWLLYHDRTSDPDTLSVEAVGRGNLLALTALGYNGPSAAEIRRIVEQATRNTLSMQDPAGQTPSNGRTDNHVWVDIGYQLAFEVMAERASTAGDQELAGRFRRAAMLAFQNAQRWRRTDREWAGSFYVTKNFFDPALRVGHQPASQYSNYNGSLMFHLAEAFHARRSNIPERPSPSEIGGYAFALDDEFSSAFANAGGMFLQANLRGQERETHANYWTPLGVVRFARPGWDSRLGPGDGALSAASGVSFAPAFEENGQWLPIAGLSKRYRATFDPVFVHPLLTRVRITYRPKDGQSGPVFRNDFALTPDGVLSELAPQDTRIGAPWGQIWPVLENDGRPLEVQYHSGFASTRYPRAAEAQNFLSLNPDATLSREEPLQRSTFGDLRPVRILTRHPVNRTFVYPASANDPTPEAVRKSFSFTSGGFSSILGRVTATTYVGRTSAGGRAKTLDLDGDGNPDLEFSEECGFIAQLDAGHVLRIEADRDVMLNLRGVPIRLKAYIPSVKQ